MNRWHFALKALIILLVAGIVGCESEISAQPNTDAHQVTASDYKEYKHKGLSLQHPKHWKLVIDEPGIVADRKVIFESPNYSRISLRFYKTQPRKYSDIANDLARELELDTSEYIQDYHRAPIEIAGYKGLRLSWKNTKLVEISVQNTILKVTDEPAPILIEFQFFDEDIMNESPHIIPFIKGITINQQRTIL